MVLASCTLVHFPSMIAPNSTTATLGCKHWHIEVHVLFGTIAHRGELCMAIARTLHVQATSRDGTTPLAWTFDSLICGGYSGRNQEAVNRHVAGALDRALRAKLVALDRLATVILGDPTVTSSTRDQVAELERAGMDAVIVYAGNIADLVGSAPPEV